MRRRLTRAGFLAGVGGTAFTRWIARAAAIASAEVAGLFAEALIAVLAGLALGTCWMSLAGASFSRRTPEVIAGRAPNGLKRIREVMP